VTGDAIGPFGPDDLAGSLNKNLLALNTADARESSLEPDKLLWLVSAS
jgi:hypothetical protein